MNLYLLSQSVNTGYDTYDSCVVAAASPDSARLIHPGDVPRIWHNGDWHFSNGEKWIADTNSTWAAPDSVTVQLIGYALPDREEQGVICSSFNAK